MTLEFVNAFVVSLQAVWNDSGFSAFTAGNGIMILVGLVLIYMAFVKEFEPLLLGPIAFGCILANFPNTGFFGEEMNVMKAINFGITNEIFPPLIFLGIGAMTDFSPLLARPSTLLLGAAAQIGVFVALGGAMVVGSTSMRRRQSALSAARTAPRQFTCRRNWHRICSAQSLSRRIRICRWYR